MPDELLLESEVGARGAAVYVWSRRGCAVHRVDPRTCEVARERLETSPLNLGGGVLVDGTRLVVASAERGRLYAAWTGEGGPRTRPPPWEVADPASTLALVDGRLVVGFQHSWLGGGATKVHGSPPLLSEVGTDRRVATVLDLAPGGGGSAGWLRVGHDRVACVAGGTAPSLARRPGVESLHALPGGLLAMVLDVPAPRRRQEVVLLEGAAGGWRCQGEGIEASLLVESDGQSPRPVLVPGSRDVVVVDREGRLSAPLSLSGHPVAAVALDSRRVVLGLSRHASGYQFRDRQGYGYVARWGLPASTSSGDVGLRCLGRGDKDWALGGARMEACASPTALAADPGRGLVYAACRRGAVSEIAPFGVGLVCGEQGP